MIELSAEQLKQLSKLDETLNKKYGESFFGITRKKELKQLSFFPTESISLNKVMGGKGIPEGRLIEIAGPKSSGKSTIATYLVSQYHKQNKLCAWFDVERAFNPELAELSGVDLKGLALSYPLNAEEGLQILIEFISSGLFSFVVVDSVAALGPKVATEKEMGEATMGILAKYMHNLCRQIVPLCDRYNCSVLFVNHLTASMSLYGPKYAKPGGVALDYYSSVQLQTREKEKIKEKDKEIGIISIVQNKKCKVGTPLKEVEISIMFPPENEEDFNENTVVGIDSNKELIDHGIKEGFIIQGGAWYTYHSEIEGEIRTQGKDKMKEVFSNNLPLTLELRAKLMGAHENHIKEEEDLSELAA